MQNNVMHKFKEKSYLISPGLIVLDATRAY